MKMLERSDSTLDNNMNYSNEFFDSNGSYDNLNTVNILPARWVTNYITKKYGVNFLKVFKDCLKKHGFIFKAYRYDNKIVKCWVK